MTSRSTPEQRKASAKWRKLMYRLTIAGGACWLLGVLASPIGLTGKIGAGSTYLRSLASTGFALTSLALVAVAFVLAKPWRVRSARSRAIGILLVAFALGDLLLLRLNLLR